MKIAIRKLASFSELSGGTPVPPSDHAEEYLGELISPLVAGHPVTVAYWQRGNQRVCGTLCTGELITVGENSLCTADGLYATRFPDAEDREGRLRVRALVPGTNGRSLHVAFRWSRATALRQRFHSLLADPYALEIAGLPMGKETGYVEELSSGVQKVMVELASLEDLEDVERRLRLLHRAMSDGIKRCWLGLADVDLRGELVIIPSAVVARRHGELIEATNFVSVVEPDVGRLLHLTVEEFPLDENFARDWQDFWRRLKLARQKGKR